MNLQNLEDFFPVILPPAPSQIINGKTNIIHTHSYNRFHILFSPPK